MTPMSQSGPNEACVVVIFGASGDLTARKLIPALYEMNDVRKIYPAEIGGRIWSAIQVTTASGICGVLDLVLANPEQYRGLVAQEAFPLPDFLKNRLGRYYATIGHTFGSAFPKLIVVKELPDVSGLTVALSLSLIEI